MCCGNLPSWVDILETSCYASFVSACSASLGLLPVTTFPINLDTGTKSPDNVWAFFYLKPISIFSSYRRCRQAHNRYEPIPAPDIDWYADIRSPFCALSAIISAFSVCFQLHFCFPNSWDKSSIFQTFLHFICIANRDNLPHLSRTPP